MTGQPKAQCECTVTREVAGLKLNKTTSVETKTKKAQSSHCLAICHRSHGHLIRNYWHLLFSDYDKFKC